MYFNIKGGYFPISFPLGYAAVYTYTRKNSIYVISFS